MAIVSSKTVSIAMESHGIPGTSAEVQRSFSIIFGSQWAKYISLRSSERLKPSTKMFELFQNLGLFPCPFHPNYHGCLEHFVQTLDIFKLHLWDMMKWWSNDAVQPLYLQHTSHHPSRVEGCGIKSCMYTQGVGADCRLHASPIDMTWPSSHFNTLQRMSS
jgi:hypothetical protein